MKHYFFGKDIAISFRAVAPTERITSAITLVNARLYTDSPTAAQKADVSGSGGDFVGDALTTWVSEGKGVYTLTFGAVDDPDGVGADVGSLYESYYVAINFTLQDSEQTQTVVKRIFLWRVLGQIANLDVSVEDIYILSDQINDLTSDAFVERKIKAATDWCLHEVKNLGLDFNRMNEVDMHLAVQYKAMEICLRDLQGPGNTFAEQAKDYLEMYKEVWAKTVLGYDTNGDGGIEPGETTETSRAVVVMR